MDLKSSADTFNRAFTAIIGLAGVVALLSKWAGKRERVKQDKAIAHFKYWMSTHEGELHIMDWMSRRFHLRRKAE